MRTLASIWRAVLTADMPAAAAGTAPQPADSSTLTVWIITVCAVLAAAILAAVIVFAVRNRGNR